MKQMTVLDGILIALAFAISAPIALLFLSAVLPYGSAFRVALALGVVVYTMLLARYSRHKSGKISSLVLVLVCAMSLLALSPRAGTFVFAACTIVWMGRTLLMAKGLLHAFTELVLVGIAVSAAAFAADITRGSAIPVWSFFLVLATGPFVAKWFESGKGGWVRSEGHGGSKFEQAYQNAENALSVLSGR